MVRCVSSLPHNLLRGHRSFKGDACIDHKAPNSQWHRAIDGWDEPVFNEGVQCGVKRKYSDSLLALAAKRHDPMYRDRSALQLETDEPITVVINKPAQHSAE